MKRSTALLVLGVGALCLGLGFQYMNTWVAILFAFALAALAWKDAQ